MRTLNVYLHDGLVGHIFENRKGGRFQYLEEVVERHTGLPVLSLSLPAKVKPFGEGKTFSWFTGLLPEGRRREDICRSLNISPYDWIGLLGAIGWECAGAVKVCQEDGEPIAPASYRVLSPMSWEIAFPISLCGFLGKPTDSFVCLWEGFRRSSAWRCRRFPMRALWKASKRAFLKEMLQAPIS